MIWSRIYVLLSVVVAAASCFPAMGGGVGVVGVESDSTLTASELLAVRMADSIASSIDLDEVVVTAYVKPIVFKGDTVLINAGSFGVRPGDRLEDLVRRIPGMSYDRETKQLTYNGKPLNEVMVNGRKFFGRDILAALGSMPADLIDKLKVYDKASELSDFTGVRSMQKNYVLDLGTKSPLDGMLSASVEVAAGNENKHEASVNGNYFRSGGDHVSLRAESGNRYDTNRYRDNRADNAYLSFSKELKKFNINGNVNYSHRINGDENTSYVETYLTGGNNYSYTRSERVGRNRSLGMGLSGSGQLGKNTFLSLNGSFNNSGGSSSSQSKSAMYNRNPEFDLADPFADPAYDSVPHDWRINGNSNGSKSRNSSDNNNFDLSLAQKIGKFSLTLSASMSNTKSDSRSFTDSKITYYQLLNHLGGDSVLMRRQFNEAPGRNRSRRVGLQLSRSFVDWTPSISYAYAVSRERSVRSTYDLAPFTDGTQPPGYLPDGYEAGYVDSLSNHSYGRTMAHELTAALGYSRWDRGSSSYNINIGLTVSREHRTLDQKTGLMAADTVRTSMNYRPSVRFYLFSEKFSLNFDYNGNTRQPSLTDLMMMTDNSNPLYVTHGNPDLRASYSQDLSISANMLKAGFNARASFSNSYNDIARAVIYNPSTGVTESYPVNINGKWNFDASVGMLKHFKRHMLIFDIGSGRTQSVGLLNDDNSGEPKRNVTQDNNCNARLHLMLNTKYLYLRGTANWRYSHSKNSLRNVEDRMRNYNFGLEMDVNLPHDIRLENRVSYSFRNGSALPGNSDEQLVWDAGASWRFLKGKSMELSVKWNDILNDRKSIYRTVSSSGVSEMRSLQIGGYFMVSLRYSFSSVKGGDAGRVTVFNSGRY